MATKDDDSIDVRRVNGVVRSAEQRTLADLIRALSTHKDEVQDVQAELALQPLDETAAARMMDATGFVSGYRQVTLAELCEQTEAGLGRWLASKLTVAAIDNVDYEAVWALGNVIVLYVRGTEAAAG